MGTKVADPVVKPCPACGAEKTAIQPRTRLESLLAFASPLRKYRCLTCGTVFKAADRRRFKRADRGPEARRPQ